MANVSPNYSIFLPVRNGGSYLPLCVESILAQTYTNFELLILENQSTDGTAEWLQTLEAKDSRIKIIPSKMPLTIESNWKRILDFPKKEFMTMTGHDDLLEPFFLEEINNLIKSEPTANLYLTHFNLIDSEGNFIRYCTPIPEYETAAEYLGCRMAEIRDSYGIGYVMRSDLYDKVGGIPSYNNLFFSDDALWLLMMENSFKFTSPRVCFSYRKHSGSLSYQPNHEDFFLGLKQYLCLLTKMANKDDQIYRVLQMYVPSYLSKYSQNYYWYLLSKRWCFNVDKKKVDEIKNLLEEFAPQKALNKSYISFCRWVAKKFILWLSLKYP